MGNNQTIQRCGDWKDTESYKQVHAHKSDDKSRTGARTTYRIIYSEDKTSSISSKSRQSNTSNVSSLVAQSMLGSTNHDDLIRNIENSYVDHSSPTKRRYPTENELNSPEPCLSSKNLINVLPSFSQPELDRSYEKGDVSEVKSIPSLKSSSGSQSIKDIKIYTTASTSISTNNSSHEDASTLASTSKYDYSSVAESIEYIRSELKNMKLQMVQSRKEQEALSHRATVTSLASTTHKEIALHDEPKSNQTCYQQSHNMIQSTTTDINWTDLQKRIRYVLDETSQTGSSICAIPSSNTATHSANDSYPSPPTVGDDLSYFSHYIHSKKAQNTNLELEIMKLDLDGDLLSVDLVSRTPRADDEISSYIRVLYKTGSDLADEEPMILPIEEVEFRTLHPEDDDLISCVYRNHKQDDIFDSIQDEYREICQTYSDDSIQGILCVQKLYHPPREDCLSDEYSDLHSTSLTPELDQQLEKIDRRLSSNRRTGSSYMSDDELDAILECSEDDDTESHTDKQYRDNRSAVASSSLYIDATQPNVLTRDLVFARECVKKWQPHLFTTSSGCVRCIFVANKSSVDDYNLLGHSKDITSTNGGCPTNCPYFHSSEAKDRVRLCQHCFDFLHHNPFSLHRQSVKSKELPGMRKKSTHASTRKKN